MTSPGDHHLLVVSGPCAPQVIALPRQGRVVVGRGTRADCRLQDPMLSRAHAAFFYQDGDLYLEDLHSSNGSFCNEERVNGSLQLLTGDRVLIGSSVIEVKPGGLSDEIDAQEVDTETIAAFEVTQKVDFDVEEALDARQVWEQLTGTTLPKKKIKGEVRKSTGREAIPGYTIVKKIGSGSHGEIYAAKAEPRLVKELSLDDDVVALKLFVKDKVRPDQLTRFDREALTAAALEHPGIMRVYDLGTTDRFYYVVMEYIRGVDLGKVVSKRGRLSWKRTVKIALKVLEALEFAHTRDIVHRDIKPENILITKDEQIKVIDFGLAKVLKEVSGIQVTQHGQGFGSVSYMPPEQISSAIDADRRADYYALGATFYRVVTGKLPFGAELNRDNLRAILMRMPRPILDIVPEVPTHIAHTLEWCMAKGPDDRPQSAETIRQGLQGRLDHIPRPQGRLQRKR